jgi:hypothetical protein
MYDLTAVWRDALVEKQALVCALVGALPVTTMMIVRMTAARPHRVMMMMMMMFGCVDLDLTRGEMKLNVRQFVQNRGTDHSMLATHRCWSISYTSIFSFSLTEEPDMLWDRGRRS